MRRLAAVLAAMLVLAGCAREGASARGGGPWGRTFLSTSASRALVPGTRIELGFGDGRLSAEAGCNHLSGDARIDGDRLVVGDLAMTEMGCDPPRQDQDAWLAAYLRAGPTVALSRAELVLERDGTRITFVDREVALPDRPLAGTEWTLDTLVSGETAGSVPAGVRAFVVFTGDGKVSGADGCNRFGGRYTIHDTTIALTDLVTTKMACAADAAEVERRVLDVLHGTVRYNIDADHLTLTDDGGNGLRFSAPAASPPPP